jgi:hypothetical protein
LEVKMTRKDFEIIAGIIQGLTLNPATMTLLGKEKLREEVAKEFAVGLAKTNPNFNAERFVLACDKAPCGIRVA